jgi:Sigma 54 modulation protein / S30EA ribosomal protein
MTMIRLVSAFILLFGTVVTGFNLHRSVVVTSRQQLQQDPKQRRSQSPTWVSVPSATTSSNEEATTTSSSSMIGDDSNAAVDSTTADNTNLPLIVVTGHHVELTTSLVEYINKRIGNILSKLANHGAVRECDVVLSVNKNPKVNQYIYTLCTFVVVRLVLVIF